MQCARPCHDTLYSSLEVAEKLSAAQARFQNFLKTYHGKKLVVLELGIGWRNQLIKAPMMRLVGLHVQKAPGHCGLLLP